MSQIELNGITKSFFVSERPEGRLAMLRGAFQRTQREVKALEEISFSIDTGELVGYIGPNGAGKSTTVKVMSGILTPDKGDCKIMQRIPWKERTAHVAQIGVVFGQRSQLWWDVPVRDSMEMLRDIYGLSDTAYGNRLGELSQALDIASLLSTPVRQLSLGQRMRCEIAAALLHSPRILFLDEPTIGLDAVSKLALREFLQQENQRHGVTMLLTTHDMDDIEALCPRVMVIGHGRLLYDGALEPLKSRYAPLRKISATLSEPVVSISIQGAERLDFAAKTCTLWFDPAKIPAHVMVARMAAALPLVDITIEEENIDTIIAAMYREMQLT